MKNFFTGLVIISILVIAIISLPIWLPIIGIIALIIGIGFALTFIGKAVRGIWNAK